ncbi:GNAT family N-acetyltransferase [Nocardia sp. CA2R105]|uniref:GNAT family N-acetyltransferase n=1 Tax=Nocardia coffeae TaxID=2873381 RepID=UPI001CA7A2E2|nr:GNAT family N-acetyltransferase [Nocardia coffeae]MBY8857406.1 GNAT family N-acetyltransferase [Nocardia coffeae]
MTERSAPLSGVTYHKLTPSDATAVQDLYGSLDEHDGYYRFFGPFPANLEPIAAQIATQDSTHCAVGAFLQGRLIGAANYVVLEDARRAEVALVVAHHDQHSGVGTTLLGHLTDDARMNGIEQFVAEIMSTNSKMMELLMDIDIPMRLQRHDNIIQAVFELSPATSTD